MRDTATLLPMRFLVKGVDRVTGAEKTIEVEAADEAAATVAAGNSLLIESVTAPAVDYAMPTTPSKQRPPVTGTLSRKEMEGMRSGLPQVAAAIFFVAGVVLIFVGCNESATGQVKTGVAVGATSGLVSIAISVLFIIADRLREITQALKKETSQRQRR